MRGRFVETRPDDGEKYAGWYAGVFSSVKQCFVIVLVENVENRGISLHFRRFPCRFSESQGRARCNVNNYLGLDVTPAIVLEPLQ